MDTIGNLLYTERRKKGLEIEDVEQATGIRKNFLNALEQGQYDKLPGEVYVKGFIRNYGNYLGLDGAHLVQLYSDSKTPAAVPQVESTTLAPVTKKKASLPENKLDKKTLSTIAVVLILAVSAWGLYAWQKGQAPDDRAISSSTGTGARQPNPASVTVSPSVGTQGGADSRALSPGNRPVVLVARYSDRCWTSVIADGKTLYEGIPKIDERFTWEAERQIVVNFGNAGAVDLTFNGQPVGKIGERGDVVVKTFTAAGATTTGSPPPAPPSVPAVPASHAAPATPTPALTPAPIAPAVPNAPGVKP